MYFRTLRVNCTYIKNLSVLKMAGLISWAVGSAAAYWVGSNLVFRSANATIDWVLNKQADPDIKEIHTVQSISAMLNAYKNLPETHPAFMAKASVEDALKDLADVIQRTKLKEEAHKGGYVTRFRTFDASDDNKLIEKKATILMERLDLFTKLMKLGNQTSDVSLPNR